MLSNLERSRLRALVDRDDALATSLHADDYELITPGGKVLDRDGYLHAIASGSIRYRRFEPDGLMRVRVHGSAAIVRYRVHIEVDVDGVADQGLFWHTDVWEVRDGHWRAVWSHATRIRSIDPG